MGEGDQGGELTKAPRTDLAVAGEGDDEIVRLTREIEANWADVRRSVDDLIEEVDETLDWRRLVRQNPWKSVGLAFALGFIFGSG